VKLEIQVGNPGRKMLSMSELAQSLVQEKVGFHLKGFTNTRKQLHLCITQM
jgi:hypothetical protein